MMLRWLVPGKNCAKDGGIPRRTYPSPSKVSLFHKESFRVLSEVLLPGSPAAHLERSCSLGSASLVAVDLVDTDEVVGPAGVEVSAALGPGEGCAGKRLLRVRLVLLHGGGGDVILDELLLGEVKNLDASLSGDHKPVESLGEEDAVDGGVAVVLGEPLALDDIPDHDLSITRARSEEGGVLDDIKGGDLSLVTLEGVEEGHVKVVPNLDGLIPRGSDAKSGLASVVEAHNRDGISVLVLVNGELALRTGVPDLDFSVEGTSDDLSVISGKSNREDVSLVTNELGDGSAGGDVPETDSAIPGGGEGKAGVTSKLDLTDEVRVASHHLSWGAPLTVLILLTLGLELPFDEGAITGTGKEELLSLSIDFFFTDGEGGNPTAVTCKKRDVLVIRHSKMN